MLVPPIVLVILFIVAGLIVIYGLAAFANAKDRAYDKGWSDRASDNDSILEAFIANARTDGIREGESMALARLQATIDDRTEDIETMSDLDLKESGCYKQPA